MEPNTAVQKIWSLCNILRGDGITYYQYVSELTYLLFLKIAQENGTENLLSDGYRWSNLATHKENGLLGFYQEMLTHLGAAASNEVVRAIYAFPTTAFSHSENLKAVIDGIADISWHEIGKDRFGDIYSGLIARSMDARSGAGQYFTPTVLVEAIVDLMQPELGEVIQDPAVGSGGFLVSADNFIRKRNSAQSYRGNPPKYQGAEIEKNTRRICLMNTFLHGLDAEIIFGDALTDDAEKLVQADLILANPPFGAKAGSQRALRTDLLYPNANKQLAFLQHIFLGLKVNGRAAVILPDNVLFEDGVGKLVRRELMDVCDLHTILRLPNGIFQGAGVQTNVLFFTKLKEDSAGTEETWFYDLRTNMPSFGKNNVLESHRFDEFKKYYGSDPRGKLDRKDRGKESRWRKLTRKQIADRDDNLDWSWLVEESGSQTDGSEALNEIAASILVNLNSAIYEIEALGDFLENLRLPPEPIQ